MTDDPDPRVRFQLAFTLGELDSFGRARALAEIVIRDGADAWVRSAILSSADDIEIRLFEALLGRWGRPTAAQSERERTEGASISLRDLARTIGIRG